MSEHDSNPSTTRPSSCPSRPARSGPSVIDIRKLYGQTGMFTYDPGFTSTASCESKITYIDGDEGVLLYRGYPIEQLAEHGDFLETCYLLLYGELPTAAQKADFDYRVTRHTMVHEQMSRFFTGFRRDAHPMAVMVGVGRRAVGLLSRLDRHLRSAPAHDRLHAHDRQDADARRDGLQVLDRPALRLSAERPRLHRRTSCACASRCRARSTRSTRCSSRALDRIFILHADHEQNASTSTVRLAGSSGANPFACIAAGIACLWGPAHGGANEAALKMLEEIGTRRPHPGIHRQGQGQERSVPPDGLRPPRLQELRPARQDHAEDHATRC